MLALTNQHGDVVGDFAAGGASLTGSQAFDPWGKVTATTGSLSGQLGYQSDDVLQNTKAGPGGRPATASKITTADGEIRFATSGDTRTGLLPPQTATAIADDGGHGGCAEINCAATLEGEGEGEGIDLQGATVQTVSPFQLACKY